MNTWVFTPSPWWVFVPKRVYVRVYTCVGQRTQKCNWICIYITLHIYIYVHLNLYVYIDVCIYIYLYIHIYFNKGADSTWNRAPSLLKECAEKVRWLGTELELERSATATVSNDFVWRLSGAHHPAFWVTTAHLHFLVWRFKRLAFGLGRVFPRSQEKKDHNLWSHIVREVMRNGPGYTSTKESWSHEWWEMSTNPPIYRPGRSITVDIDGR